MTGKTLVMPLLFTSWSWFKFKPVCYMKLRIRCGVVQPAKVWFTLFSNWHLCSPAKRVSNPYNKATCELMLLRSKRNDQLPYFEREAKLKQAELTISDRQSLNVFVHRNFLASLHL